MSLWWLPISWRQIDTSRPRPSAAIMTIKEWSWYHMNHFTQHIYDSIKRLCLLWLERSMLSWWLQLFWCQIGTRPSSTSMMTHHIIPSGPHIFCLKNFWHFHKNTRLCVENECCCPHTVNISNVNFKSNCCSIKETAQERQWNQQLDSCYVTGRLISSLLLNKNVRF